MSLQFADIDDAVLTTQELYIKKGAFLDLQTDLSEHILVNQLWKGRKKKFGGGHPWEFQAQIDHNHSAKTVGLYETDGSAQTDTMIQGSVVPRHVNAHYLYDLREPAFQRGGKAITDLVYTRYVAMMVSMYEFLEEILWGKPATDADTKTPFGIEYWITKSTSEGFNGGNPTGFTGGKAGISQGTYGRWANWTNDYDVVSKEDLLRSMRRMQRKINFKSPVNHAQPTLGSDKKGIYTNDVVVGLMEELVEAQNMNLGNDLDSKGGQTMFKGMPIQYAPFLDNDTEDPVYMIDFKWLALGVLQGWENQLSKPYMVPNKSKVRRVDLDSTLQMVCTNLRRQGVLHNPA